MGRSCQKRCALRPSVVFPDFCVLQVMRARDLPYAYAFFCSRPCCWPFQCPRGKPFREVATVNYEDRDPPAKRGRAEGQMPDFGFAAWGCGTADRVRVKTELILFFHRRSRLRICDLDIPISISSLSLYSLSKEVRYLPFKLQTAAKRGVLKHSFTRRRNIV